MAEKETAVALAELHKDIKYMGAKQTEMHKDLKSIYKRLGQMNGNVRVNTSNIADCNEWKKKHDELHTGYLQKAGIIVGIFVAIATVLVELGKAFLFK